MDLGKAAPSFSRRLKWMLIILTVIILIALVTIVAFKMERSDSQSSPQSNITSSTTTKSLFGTMIAFNISDAINDTPGGTNALQNGWTEFKKDNLAYQNLFTNLQKVIEDNTKLVKTTGFALDRGSFGYFTWNVIEPQKGQFDWGLTDLYAKGASNADVKISAVIQPFATWDQKNTQINADCKMLDAAYYDYKAGPPNDISEYENFLTKTVERYKDSVAIWEIGNEPDANCNGYQNNPEAYFNLIKTSSETIKKANPQAKVVNGGASGHSNNTSEVNFWTKFFVLGGGQYIDYFNLHYNTERSQDAKLDSTAFEKNLTFWNDLINKNGDRKPLYLTEFGIYSGTPSDQPAGQSPQGQVPAANQPVSPNQGENQDGQASTKPLSTSLSLSNESQDAQATLYFQDSILAFTNDAKYVFIDLVGPDGGLVGSSMAFNTDNQPRLFLATLKTIDQKLVGFSKSEKVAEGQYKFTIDGKTIYALWSSTLPSEISGKVKVTDIKGQEQTLDALAIKLSADKPVLVELQN
jgi:hypothetical protein